MRRKSPLRSAGLTSSDIDYKNLSLLKKFITETGKIAARRMTGLSAKQQRALARAVKLARYADLLPFCDQH